jgi:hypothetical protein
MTAAMGKQVALGVFGAAGIAATLISAILIWTIVTGPDRLVMAMNEGSAREFLTLVVERIAAFVAWVFSPAP